MSFLTWCIIGVYAFLVGGLGALVTIRTYIAGFLEGLEEGINRELTAIIDAVEGAEDAPAPFD